MNLSFCYTLVKMALPQFLGIGVAKGGTTWLHEGLAAHPEIWMPPLKEINYFANGMNKQPTLFQSFFDKRFRNLARIRKYLRLYLRNNYIFEPVWKQHWMFRYFFRRKNKSWYNSLFFPGPQQIAGEISPVYMKLRSETVAGIKKMLPEAGIIVFLRNPIDRAKAQILWDYMGGDGPHNLGSIDQEACLKHIEKYASRHEYDYPRVLQAWENHFPPEQMFVAFFEELQDCPDDLLLRIYRFIGVEASPRHFPGTLRQRVNENKNKPELPAALDLVLAEKYLPQLQVLAKRFNGYPQKWLEEAEEILKNPRTSV